MVDQDKFHVMQNVARMPVGENVIQGTTDQMRDLIPEILRLAPDLGVIIKDKKVEQ